MIFRAKEISISRFVALRTGFGVDERLSKLPDDVYVPHWRELGVRSPIHGAIDWHTPLHGVSDCDPLHDALRPALGFRVPALLKLAYKADVWVYSRYKA